MKTTRAYEPVMAGVPSVDAVKRRRAVVATLIGSALEVFDFSSYGFFAVIIAKLFFPSSDDLSSMLLTAATFGVGFFMRPVGGIILGIYGDRVGRKKAMSLTIGLMALGIGLVGFAPTYSQIGVGGALIVLLGRLLQGFSAGGEMGNATAFLVEYVPRHQRGFYSSLIQSRIGLAVLAGAGVGTLITGSLSPESLESWGWRVPFLIGLLIGPIGYYIRQHVDETPDFAAEKKASSPLSEVLRLYPRGAIAGFLMVILWTVCTYVLLYYMPTYVVKTLKMAQSQGFIGSVFAGFIILVVSPAIGALSDRIGRRVFLAGGALAIGVLAWPMFSYIDTNRSLASLLVFEGVFGLLICCYTGPILVTFASLFPTRVRSTGLSLSYNLAVTVFGGFASLIITLLISKTGSNLAPAYYVIAAAVLSLIGTLIYREHGAGA